MPAIGRMDVACAEWPRIRGLEHFLQLLDLVNDAFNVHPSQYPTLGCQSSNGAGLRVLPARASCAGRESAFPDVLGWSRNAACRFLMA